jgi:hypothetical protein
MMRFALGAKCAAGEAKSFGFASDASARLLSQLRREKGAREDSVLMSEEMRN